MSYVKDIVIQRINILFNLAERMFLSYPELSQRYINLARKMGMRCNVRIPKKWRRRFCRKCGNFLWPGVSCRVRIRQNRFSHIVITCLKCGYQKRIPIK